MSFRKIEEVKMGADVKLHTKEKEIYFRDAYNATNLAWVIGESYWAVEDKANKRLAFMKKLSEITDEQIDVRVKYLHENTETEHITPGKEGWTKMFKAKRDELKKSFEKGIIKVTWSV